MNIQFRPYLAEDIPAMRKIWNDIIEDGVAFPGTELLDEDTFKAMLLEQSAAICMFYEEDLAGYFILHPNNIGRCSHVANASYAISKQFRGRHLGKLLVDRSIAEAKELGFRGIQFNAVVVSNKAAIHIYQNAGFQIIGTIPKGFLLKDGVYSDMLIMYLEL